MPGWHSLMRRSFRTRFRASQASNGSSSSRERPQRCKAARTLLMGELEQLLAELRELSAEVQSGDLTQQWRFFDVVDEVHELFRVTADTADQQAKAGFAATHCVV